MATGLNGTVKVQAAMIATLAAGVNRTAAEDIDLSPAKTNVYSDGATAGKVQRAYYAPLTFVSSTPQTLDLSAIVCADGSVGMAYVREILVFNDSATDGQVITYGGGTNPFTPDLAGTTPTEKIQAGTSKRVLSKPLGATGHAVSTNVNVKLDPGSAAFAGRILILGHN